ncbi:MAG: hypothetical protein ACRCSV_01295 [Chlamydiales bacterium]
MTISNISAPGLFTGSYPTPPHALQVGQLKFGDHIYTVTVESSDPLISSPLHDTIEKIQDLVQLHLNHLESKGADLSKIVIQQLDEEGLSYVNWLEDNQFKPKTLPSSELNFSASTFSPSLQDSSISSILDIYRSIIDPLMARKNSEQEKGAIPRSIKKFGKRIIFTQDPQQTLVKTPENPNSQNNRKVENNPSQQTSKTNSEVEDSSKNDKSETETASEPESSSLLSRLWNGLTRFTPSFSWNKTDEYEKLINVKETVDNDQTLYLESNTQAQRDSEKFGTSSFA